MKKMYIIRARLLLFIACCGMYSSINAQKNFSDAFTIIDSAYKKYALENNIPGMAFGIVAESGLIYAGAHGYSDLDRKMPVTSSSVFRIASMTKSFTAMAILKLRDQGKLRLDDPVHKFIPEIKNTKPLTEDSPPITIRHLLTHRAGFPEDNPWGDRQLQRSDEELSAFLKNGVSLSNPPNLEFEYSNLGFALLGAIITKASGMHYEKYINENIFRALGMNNTYWEYDKVPDSQLVHGYRIVNSSWKAEEMLHSGAYGAMGGLLTSIEDFSRYIRLHISSWPARSDKESSILRRSSIREMHFPDKVSGFNAAATDISGKKCPAVRSYNFGLAWMKNCSGKEYVSHSGGLPGFGSHWVFLPEYGIGIVSFSNLTYAASSALNLRIIDTLIQKGNLQPHKIQASTILRKRKDQLMQILPDWNDAESSGIFSENFFHDYFIDSLKKESVNLFSRAGKIINVGEIIPENQLRGYFVIEGEKSRISIRFTLTPENPALIQEYSIHELPAKESQAFNKYKLKTISTLHEYEQHVKNDSKQKLIPLDKGIPDIALDLKYATPDNLMNRPLYSVAKAYLRAPAAAALHAVQKELRTMGYGLKIFDAYRPYAVTVIFYEKYQDSTFVASPFTGSRHNRGCAVDLTLIDLNSGKELEMPTAYDSFTKEAHTDYQALSQSKIQNRELLKKVMLKHGFEIYASEWWHYDFKGWKQFPVMDISIAMLHSNE